MSIGWCDQACNKPTDPAGVLAKLLLRSMVLLCLLSGLAAQVQAKNILVLTGQESSTDAINVQTNALAEFTTPGTQVDTVINMNVAGVLTQAMFQAKTYDLVVVIQLSAEFDQDNVKTLKDAIKNRWANGFALFYDTGGDEAKPATQAMKSMLKDSAGIDWTSTTTNSSGDLLFQLNTNSAYKSSFTALNPLRGGYFFYMNGIPAPNVLYLAPGQEPPAANAPANTLVDNVYSVFVPATQSFSGKGACLIASSDSSMFESRNYDGTSNGWGAPNTSGFTNEKKIAPAFELALAPGGVCGIPAGVSKVFAPTSVGPGDVSTLTIHITNSSTSNLTGVTLKDKLPSPLVFAQSADQVGNTCAGGNLSIDASEPSLTLVNAQVPPGGCALTVQVRWPAISASECVPGGKLVTNTITPGTDFLVDQASDSTPAVASLTCEGGALQVNKRVDWLAGSQSSNLSATSYGVDVSCTSALGDAMAVLHGDITVDANGAGSASFSPVVTSGTCTVSETSRSPAPANHQWVETVLPSVTVGAPAVAGAPAHATLTNTLARSLASIALQKNIVGAAAGGVTGSFVFTAQCGSDGTHMGQVVTSQANTGAGTIAGVPAGANCSVSEVEPLPTAPANYRWGAVPAPQSITDVQTGSALIFSNTLIRNTASLSVNLSISGAPAEGVSGIFKFQASCGNDGNFSTQVSLSNARSGTATFADVPAGASCTISEDAALPAPPTGLVWGALPAAQTVGDVQTGSSASFQNQLSSTPVAAAATPVPSLRAWALVLLSVAMLAAFAVRRRTAFGRL